MTLSAAEDADTVNGTAIFSVASSGLTSVNVNASEADNDVALPSLVSVVVNGADTFFNQNQRSQITSIVITTSAPIANPQTAFSITNIGLFTPTDTPIASSQIQVTASGNVYTLRFLAGPGVVTRLGSGDRGNSLDNGNYVLTVASDRVLGSNTFGAAAADRFFRMYGDSDGDGDNDGADTFAFRSAQQSSNLAFRNSALDYDGDGSVTMGVDSTQLSETKNRRRRLF